MTINKYIILALSTLMLAGCASDDDFSQEQSRLPLTFETSLSGSRPVTRAVGGEFENSDELLCYVRHVAGSDVVQTKMVTIKNNKPTEPLYWDDFSESTNDGSKDLRTKDHGLQSYYGYCYNGGTPTTDLVEATGVLGWTINADQTVYDDLKHNDLIWSKEQSAITYDHARKNNQGELEVPYYHAMSKFTIVLVAGDGFEAKDLGTATITLKDMNLKGTFTAPNFSVVADGTTTEVKMYANSVSTTNDKKPCRAYEAVSVPLVSLTTGNPLATINNVGGNNYQVNLTNDILSDWAAGIDNGKTQSGINYKLTITLNKQAITVVATLADWTEVSATGKGAINFTADVTSINKDNDGITNGDAFTLWKMSALTNEAFAKAKKTKVTYENDAFTYEHQLYWDNALDNSFFRALAQKGTNLTAVEEPTLEQGTDLLWGTTAEHTGTEADGTTTHEYKEGVAINPRTGDVPLIFKHVMSNVVVKLETTTDDSQVETGEATITMTKINKDGKFSIFDGEITSVTTPSTITVDGETIMVPQDIDDEAKLIITLKDGTTYSLLLNTCKDKDGAVKKWESGKQYEYTISLKKEEIQFRVMVKEWTKDESSGKATLDWD